MEGRQLTGKIHKVLMVLIYLFLLLFLFLLFFFFLFGFDFSECVCCRAKGCSLVGMRYAFHRVLIGFGGQMDPTLHLCSALFSSLEGGGDSSFLGGLVCKSELTGVGWKYVICCAFAPVCPYPSPACPHFASPFYLCLALSSFHILLDWMMLFCCCCLLYVSPPLRI